MNYNNYQPKYDDIIDLPHHTSSTRPHMSNHDRAAQFSPFAALTGYDECVREEARLTDDMEILAEDAIDELNRKLGILDGNIDFSPVAAVEYFVPDKLKNGGKYMTASGVVTCIDPVERVIVLDKKIAIPVSSVRDIQCEFFGDAD